MTTDTFETPRIPKYDTADDTPPTLRRPTDGHHPPGGDEISARPMVADRLREVWAGVQRLAARGIDAARGAWRRLRQTLGEWSTRIPRPEVTAPSLDTSIVIVWALAVALVAVQVALVVSSVLGIALALAEGVALGASGRRLYQLVTRT